MSKKQKSLEERLGEKIVFARWRDVFIDGRDTDCRISDTGLVWNKRLKRFITLDKSYNGYLRAKFGGVRLSIHRTVAQYFVPNPDPDNKIYVNHIDGNKLNNYYKNLEWVTAKENTRHAMKSGLFNPHHGNQRKGSENGISTHTEEQAHEVCKYLEAGHGISETARLTNLEYEFVRSMKRGWWKHVTCFYNIPSSKKYNMPNKYIKKRVKRDNGSFAK